MKAKKGILYLTLCIISTMLLLGWYVARIHEIIEFNEKILVSLQTYAEQESEGLIYRWILKQGSGQVKSVVMS